MKNANYEMKIQEIILSESDIDNAIFLIDSLLANDDNQENQIDVLECDYCEQLTEVIFC